MTDFDKELLQMQLDRHEMWLKMLTQTGIGTILCVAIIGIYLFRN